MGTLTVTLAGICCQFHDGVVPGVQHRTVFPNALGIQLGVIKLPPDQTPTSYYLMPHLAFVTNDLDPTDPDFWHTILYGARLTIDNASRQDYAYDNGAFPLTRYVEEFEPSHDVVFAENADAMAHFDFAGGRFEKKTLTTASGDGAQYTVATVQTDDDTPLLRIQPFNWSPMSPFPEPIPIHTKRLVVTNLDYLTAAEDTDYDFLLNYLVGRGGIPKALILGTPGLDNPSLLTMQDLGGMLQQLGTKIANNGQADGLTRIFPSLDIVGKDGQPDRLVQRHAAGFGVTVDMLRAPVPANQSCSDSQYP
jgi:hypothetical protein